MSLLAPTLEAFFRAAADPAAGQRAHGQRLPRHLPAAAALRRRSNRETPISSWRSKISTLVIGRFLEDLERNRHNSVRTRNARLAAIHSLFRYAALRHPEHADVIQRVLAIPHKRFDRALVCFLTRERDRGPARRPQSRHPDRPARSRLLLVAVQTGLRISELTGLTCANLRLGAGRHLFCRGKNRKQRCVPLTAQTVAVLKTWLAERHGEAHDVLFPTNRGGRLSRDTVQWLITKHVAAAAHRCPSLATKHITSHVLRHTCAMNLRQAGVDVSVIALWLGHEGIETTSIYLNADLRIDEQALARTAPPGTSTSRYRAPDTLLAFLDGL